MLFLSSNANADQTVMLQHGERSLDQDLMCDAACLVDLDGLVDALDEPPACKVSDRSWRKS